MPAAARSAKSPAADARGRGARAARKLIPRPTNRFEKAARLDGFRLIAGVDEAGRGCLFGPVTAAAVILDPGVPLKGLADSKLLEADVRETLAPRIRERAVAWAVAGVDAAWIDRVNIYQAARIAMERAVAQLNPEPDYLLIDAMKLALPQPQRSLIKGDLRSRSIAAASILAKTARDEWMRHWAETYPEYNLASNKGYATPDHLAALAEHGPTPAHRLSFEPVAAVARFGKPADPASEQMALFAQAGGAG